MFTDTYWMTQALELAKRAAQMGEVPVGAVIVRNDRLIATAHNLRQTDGNPVAHAEILAIQSAANRSAPRSTIRLWITPMPRYESNGFGLRV